MTLTKEDFDQLSNDQKADILFKKAAQLHQDNKLDEALPFYAQAIAIKPDFPDAYNNMAVALRKKKQYEAALACYRRALTLRPDHAGTYSNMGNVLNDLDYVDASLKAHQKALELEPDNLLYRYNFGLVLRDKGKLKEAIKNFDAVLEKDPAYGNCPWDRSLTHLMNANFKTGFDQYESRWDLEKSPPRTFNRPQWNGEAIKGKTLLIHREQGFGDAIQFMRLIRPIKEKYGCRLILECQPELITLFSRCADLDGLVPYGNQFPNFDVWCPMLSLGRFLTMSRNKIPGPYPVLTAPKTSRLSVRPALKGGKNIAIVWAGSPTHQNDRRRSVSFERFLPLIGMAQTTVFSLQKGPRSDDIAKFGAAGLVIDAGSQLRDFNDSAALINQMDLVISVDTAVVHLASSMGKPVWLMLPFTPDWRWQLKRQDSPWYPDMRIFRQKKPGDWHTPFDEMLKALTQELDPNKRLTPENL